MRKRSGGSRSRHRRNGTPASFPSLQILGALWVLFACSRLAQPIRDILFGTNEIGGRLNHRSISCQLNNRSLTDQFEQRSTQSVESPIIHKDILLRSLMHEQTVFLGKVFVTRLAGRAESIFYATFVCESESTNA